MTGTDASNFEIFDGDLYLRSGVALNFENQSSYDVTVNVDDNTIVGDAGVSANFTLSVIDVNEEPTAISLTNTISSINENTATSSRTKVADINISDDSLGTNSLTLTGTDASNFEIFDGDLYLRSGVALNFENQSSYDVTVNVDDNTIVGDAGLGVNFTLQVNDTK